MNCLKLPFIYLMLMAMSAAANAQDLYSHRWKHRLVLILLDDKDYATYEQQLAEFRSAKAGMKERKLVVYHISPEEYRRGLDEQGKWTPATGLFSKYKQTEAGFELILIGLDGGVKLRTSDFLPAGELFNLIDSMPMRQEEIRKNQEK